MDLALFRKMTGETEPTLRGLAEGLSKVPRWLNRMVAPWSVLQHSLACAVAAGRYTDLPVDRLAVLFHDAEEMLTSDIPTPLKTQEQHALGDRVRAFLWQRIVGIPQPGAGAQEVVARVDRELLFAEAHVLGHPRLRAAIGGEPSPEVEDVVWGMLDMTPREQVHSFVSIVEPLLEAPTVRALRRGAA